MLLPFCLDLFVQNILFYIKEADLSIFLEFQELPHAAAAARASACVTPGCRDSAQQGRMAGTKTGLLQALPQL